MLFPSPGVHAWVWSPFSFLLSPVYGALGFSVAREGRSQGIKLLQKGLFAINAPVTQALTPGLGKR